jgi:hypothetical protein
MRIITVSALILAGFTLGGCVASTAPVGVLPRDPVPPPPSVASQASRGNTASPSTRTAAQRRTLSVPGQTAPRP